jgi:hypothetical protein
MNVRWRILLAAGLLLSTAVLIDRTVGKAVERAVAPELVDLRTPAMLFAKLEYLRKFPGYKVVLLGDSVVYGESLRQHGDRRWREHNLARLLQNRLQARLPERPVLVLNLAINGCLPADLERLNELLEPCHPDLVVFDLNLRAFSADFAAADKQCCRPWLQRVSIDPAGRYVEHPQDTSLLDALQCDAKNFLNHHSKLYALRELTQYRLYDTEAAAALALRHPAAAEPQLDTDLSPEAFKLMQARRRYRSITLDSSNPQWRALKRTLAYLTEPGQPTVVFYARENPDDLDDIINPSRYRAHLDRLESLLGRYQGPGFRYVPPIDAIPASCYLDHVHVDYTGYQVVADYLVNEITASLAK